MARKLENQVNVIAPNSDYPYGRIRDDEGVGNGTPLTEAVHGDYHQFFARILAEGGVAVNNMPDNEYTGFQYYEALLEVISKRIGRYSIGDSVSGGLSDNLNDYVKVGVFVVTPAFSNKPAGLGDYGQLVVTSRGAIIAQVITDMDHGAIWSRVFDVSWSAWVLQKLAERAVPIGDWDMDANPNVTVDIGAHGIDISKIASLNVSVRADVDASFPSANYQSLPQAVGISGYALAHAAAIIGVGVQIFRLNGSGYDSTDFDATGYNRGWIVVTWVPS